MGRNKRFCCVCICACDTCRLTPTTNGNFLSVSTGVDIWVLIRLDAFDAVVAAGACVIDYFPDDIVESSWPGLAGVVLEGYVPWQAVRC